MELIIKMLFILSLFMFNVSVLRPLLKIKDDAEQKVAFMLLCGFNVIATTGILAVLHEHMLTNMPLLAFSGFIGGAAILGVSITPFANKIK